VIDGVGDTVLRRFRTAPFGYGRHGLCLSPDGHRVYAALGDDYEVMVIDGQADTVVCRVPVSDYVSRLCYVPAYDYVYASAFDLVDVIDCKQNVVIAQVEVLPYALLYNPVGSKVYIASGYIGTVSVVAGERPELLTQINVGSEPTVLCLDSRDNKVYCTGEAGSEVVVIDASADTVVARVAVGNGSCDLSYDSLNNYVYCACRRSNEVYVIDAHRDSVVTTIGVGSEPVALAWSPTGLRTYVANYSGASVSVICDSLHVGIEEASLHAFGVRPGATVARGALCLASGHRQNAGCRAELLDISGRKVLDLTPGANDVRRLAPGVYFVLEASSVGRDAPSITKVVITR
jgi:YVTN family beta-propeller protein